MHTRIGSSGAWPCARACHIYSGRQWRATPSPTRRGAHDAHPAHGPRRTRSFWPSVDGASRQPGRRGRKRRSIMTPYDSLGNCHQDPYGHLHAWPLATTTTTVIDLISMTSPLSIHRDHPGVDRRGGFLVASHRVGDSSSLWLPMPATLQWQEARYGRSRIYRSMNCLG
jgi:hypothetical protein